MFVTVAICSRNRAEQLNRALHTAAAMRVPRNLTWEFLLVDNGSTDQTPQVVESFRDRLPIRHVFEPIPGLSNARNRAVAEARGTYLCWTDDDVSLDPDWLASYASSFADNPGAAFFGGPIQLVLEGEQADWIVQNRARIGSLWAERDFGPEPVALTIEHDRLPYGANYAVRTNEQKQYLYDPQLGVAPGQRRLGEETAVMREFISNGCIGVWVPGARVLHHIPGSRQTLEYVSSYQRACGETWAYLDHQRRPNFMGVELPPGGRRAFGIPLWFWRRALTHRVRLLIGNRSQVSAQWLDEWMGYAYYRGVIDYGIRVHGLFESQQKRHP